MSKEDEAKQMLDEIIHKIRDLKMSEEERHSLPLLIKAILDTDGGYDELIKTYSDVRKKLREELAAGISKDPVEAMKILAELEEWL
jgi:hypothetical protein